MSPQSSARTNITAHIMCSTVQFRRWIISVPTKSELKSCLQGLMTARLRRSLWLQTRLSRARQRQCIFPVCAKLLEQEHAKHPKNPYMFPSPVTGEMYHPDAIVKIHRKICKDIGLEHVRFHDLRHSFATTALQCGVDVKTVSTMLGHSSAGFTLNVYTHSTSRMQQEAARTVGKVMPKMLER